MADYNDLFNQFIGVDPNDPAADDTPDNSSTPPYPIPVPNIGPAYPNPRDIRVPTPSLAVPTMVPPGGGPSHPPALILPPPNPPSEASKRAFQASTDQREPGDPSLTDAAWAERPISGIRNRLKRGVETMGLTGLGGQSSPRAALGQMAGSFLTGLIYPKAANAAYQERIARPRQEREIADATAKRDREYKAKMEEQETAIRAGQIEAQGRAAAAAKWIVISPAGGTVGANGKRYQVLHDTSSPNNDNDQWLQLPDPEEKLHNVPKNTTVLGANNRVVYQTKDDAAATPQKPAMSAADAKALAPGELFKELGKNPQQFGEEYWLGRKDTIVKAKADELPGGYDNLVKRAAAGGGKTADAKAALKTIQDISTAQEKIAHAEADAEYARHLSRKEQELMFPNGLPGGQGVKAAGAATPAPTGAPSAAPTGAAPQANYAPRQNTSGQITQAGTQARLDELSKQLGLNPNDPANRTKLTAILRQEGWLP